MLSGLWSFDGEIEEGHERYTVFMSSEPILGSIEAHIGLYNDRQEIEAGYKQANRFMAKTTSTNLVLRFSTSHSPACYIRSGG